MLTERLERLRERLAPAASDERRARFLAALPQAAPVAAAVARRIEDPGWRLELTKAVLREGFVVLLPGERGARARLAHLTRSQEDGPELRELRRRAAARFALSAEVALGVWADSLLRAPGQRPALPERALVIAVHGEVTNRTKHVLGMAARSRRPVVILVLGRPRTDLTEIRALFADLGLEDAVLVRPLDLASGVRALPHALRRLLAGFQAQLDVGFTPLWDDEIGSIYRVLLGEAHAAWWRDQGWDAGVVYYGYTGTADTDALERAQQADGVITVHCVHGVCDGWNLAGHSSLAVFQCAYDARIHAAYRAYRATTSRPVAPPPPWTRGAGDWLVLTNFVHPTNPFASFGAAGFEQEVIEAVAWAAGQVGWPLSRVTWRPHPAFWTMPDQVTAPLLARADALGLRVSRAGEPMPDLRACAVVVSVASTSVLDALSAGVLPVVYAPQPLSPDALYAALPGLARTRAELLEAIRWLDHPDRAEQRFLETYELAGPGSGPWDLRWLEERVDAHPGDRA